MLEMSEEFSNSTRLVRTDDMDAALAHARMTLGLNWVAADDDTRIYAYAVNPIRKRDIWAGIETHEMRHIGYYTGKQSWRNTKRGVK